jgi:sporulation protein YhbH
MILTSIFRPYSPSDSLRSDRSAGDRQRHRQKVRKSVQDNIADLIAEESIIGKHKDKIVKVPIRGVKEYRFIYGENTPGVGQGDGNSQPGQVVGKGNGQGQGQGQDQAGDQPGEDYYETDVTLDELIEIMFEDLELPNMERKILREVMAERLSKRKGYRKAGIRIRLDKKRTAISRIKRKVAAQQDAGDGEDAAAADEEERFPFRKDDMTYRHLTEDVRPDSNAVVICIMDTSGSMDTTKKYLARSFFFLLYQFVSAKYHNVELVFVAHHTEGKEVTEEEFFHKGESGGTLISSGYNKALEIIRDRCHPSLWNIYAFHCSDGDNFSTDNPATLTAAKELCEVCNLFGYGEIKPAGAIFYESSMIELFRQFKADNFKAVTIAGKEFIWSSFREFLSRDRAGAPAAAA